MKCVLACVGALLVLQGVFGWDHEAAKKKLHDFRIHSQNLHIDQLEHDVSDLEHEFEKLSSIPSKKEVYGIKARVRNLEGHHCEEGRVPCGGEVPECISPLFVCDGHKDCKNGRDENPQVCSDEPYRVGSSLAGVTTWTDCFTHRPHWTVVTITANEKAEHFQSQVYVKAVASFEVDEHSHLVKSHSLKGYWSPGKRYLALFPDDPSDEAAQGFGILCRFHLGNNHEADCAIGSYASKHICGRFRGARP